MKRGIKLKGDNFGAISDHKVTDESIRSKFIELIATIIVEKIFRNYVPEESNRIHKDIPGPAK